MTDAAPALEPVATDAPSGIGSLAASFGTLELSKLLSGEPERIPTIADLRTSARAVDAGRVRLPAETKRWQDLGKTDRSSPALGKWVTFDFGREVMAYLALRFPSQVGEDSQPVGQRR